MSELLETLLTLGKGALALPTLDAEVILSVEELALEETQKRLTADLTWEKILGPVNGPLDEIPAFSKNDEKYRVGLAAKINMHDLRRLAGQTNRILSDIAYTVEEKGLIQHENITELQEYLTLFRAGCLSLAYLASGGDPAYNIPIPAELGLRAVQESRPACNQVRLDETLPPTVRSADLFVQYQFERNAQGARILSITTTSCETRLQVADEGTGLLRKNRTPLPMIDFPNLFEGGSTKPGGGIGLHVAAEIAHLRQGHIEVISRVEECPSFCYDTRSRTCTLTAAREKPGCTFTLYVPREV